MGQLITLSAFSAHVKSRMIENDLSCLLVLTVGQYKQQQRALGGICLQMLNSVSCFVCMLYVRVIVD